jgi:hypothetical protein
MRTRTTPARLAALCSLAALALAPVRPATADDGAAAPRLPKGWIRGGAGLEKLAPPPPLGGGTRLSNFQSNHEFTFRTRPAIPGGRVDLAKLPVVEIDPPAPADPPAELPAGAASDVVVLRKGAAPPRVSVRGFEAGQIRVGKANPTAIGRQSEGGAAGACGPTAEADPIRPLSYEAIRRVDAQGAIELVWARGFLETATCRVAIVERHSARPQHVGGGVVYAFRTHCAACAEGSREVLHVLTPQMEDRFEKSLPFEHRTLPLAPGKSGAFEGSSSFRSPFSRDPWSLPDWDGVIDRQCQADTVWCGKDVRLEVSQGRGETAPVVFVGGDVGM